MSGLGSQVNIFTKKDFDKSLIKYRAASDKVETICTQVPDMCQDILDVSELYNKLVTEFIYSDEWLQDAINITNSANTAADSLKKSTVNVVKDVGAMMDAIETDNRRLQTSVEEKRGKLDEILQGIEAIGITPVSAPSGKPGSGGGETPAPTPTPTEAPEVTPTPTPEPTETPGGGGETPADKPAETPAPAPAPTSTDFKHEQSNSIADMARARGWDEDKVKIAVGIARWETGNYTSNLYNKNNFGGMRGKNGWLTYDTPQAGMEAYLNNLEKNYFNCGLTTPEAMQSKYCPDGSAWANGVRGCMS